MLSEERIEAIGQRYEEVSYGCIKPLREIIADAIKQALKEDREQRELVDLTDTADKLNKCRGNEE